jgi:hypothetical protein
VIDEAEEVDHCEEAAADPCCEVPDCVIKTYAEIIRLERAAVRAECEAEIAMLKHSVEDIAECYRIALHTLMKQGDELKRFRDREPYVRALVGAVEDAEITQVDGEWRLLVDWEMDHPEGKP